MWSAAKPYSHCREWDHLKLCSFRYIKIVDISYTALLELVQEAKKGAERNHTISLLEIVSTPSVNNDDPLRESSTIMAGGVLK